MFRKIVVGLLLTVLLMTIAGTAMAKKTLTVAQVADISTLDPQKAVDIYSGNVMKQIYNWLVKLDASMELHPDLAESWENPDENTWVFYLKEGVKFHNGEELTAEDVKFTIERILDPATAAPGAWLVEQIVDIEVIDPYTIKFITGEPFAALLTSLARYELGILNEKAVTASGEDYAREPIGTGPFKFERHYYGDKVVLSKFEDYFEGPAEIDEIVYRAIPEDATRVVELEAGGLDIMYDLPSQEYSRLSGNANLKIYETLGQSTEYLGINAEIEPFQNELIRQAVNYAIDKEALVQAVFFGKAAPSFGPLSPSIWGFDRSLPPAYPYNPEKSKELLAEAGYPNGFDCTILTDPRTERKSASELVQAYLAQVGIRAEVEILEWGTLLAVTSEGPKGMFILGYTGTGDADGGLYPKFHSKNIGASNRNRFATAELDQLLDVGRITVDIDERRAIYQQAQRYIVDHAVEVFLVVPQILAVSNKNVEGFNLFPNNINPLYDVKLND